MIKKLLKKYKEQEERIMFHLKSKYSTEKIEKLEKMARKVCSFLIFLNMCTLMLNVQAFTKGIEEAIKEEASTLTVIISDSEDNKNKTNESQVEIIKTENIDHFSQEVENLNSNSSMETTKENPYATKRLIVMANSPKFNSYEAKDVINFDNLYILQYETEEQTQNAYEQLKNANEIESVEIDAVMEAESLEEGSEEVKSTLEDTELKKYLNTLQAVKEVKTAILDTGLNSSDLIDSNRIIDTKVNLSTTGEKNSTADDNGHGTEMAELIAKNSNNNVKIMPIKVANNQGKATILNVYVGIQKAIEKGANVINISMNTVVSAQSQILSKAISEASEQGILFIVSAGNDNEDVRNYTPSNISSAIVVSAVEEDNNFASYSNYGQTIDYSTYGNYNGKTGTSYSAATVTGIMADLLSKNQEISSLDSYAIDLGENGFDPYFGKGFIGTQFKGEKQEENNENNNNKDEQREENNNDNNTESNNTNDEIPPDYFENSIFGAPWKTLSDEEVKEKLENAEEAKMAIFLQHLSKEDLELILNKKTILNNEYVQYEYMKDENNNLIVDEKALNENGEENILYKVEKDRTTPYYQYLLELDFSTISISEFSSKSGYFYVYMTEEDSEATVLKSTRYKITLKVGKTNWSSTQDVTEFGCAVAESGKKDHFLLEIESMAKTKEGANSEGKGSGAFDVFFMKVSYDRPAYTMVTGSSPDEKEKRMNFKHYTVDPSEGTNTLPENNIQYDDTVKEFKMCVNAINAGMATGGEHKTMEVYNYHPFLEISYNLNGGMTANKEQYLDEIFVDYNNSVALNNQTITKQGYSISNNTKWKRKSAAKIFAAGVNNSAITYKEVAEGADWGAADYREVEFIANWVANTYTVTYNGNGATGGSTANSSHTYDVEKALTANGYTRAYTVTYDYNGNGQNSSSETANYQFNGWATTATGAVAYTNSKSVKNLTTTNGGTVTLYANWSSTSVTLPTPTRTGYIFLGWYDAETGGNKIGDGGASYTPTENKRLYAHWTPITYYVAYNGNGATGGTMTNSTHTYDEEKSLKRNEYTKSYTLTLEYNADGVSPTSTTVNWKFAGWATRPTAEKLYNEAEKVSNLTTENRATIGLFAKWEPSSTSLPTLTRTGYLFQGWYDAASGGSKIADGGSSYSLSGNKTLYAHWTPITYYISYNGNGATGGNTETSTHIYDQDKNLSPNRYTRAYTVTYNYNGSGQTTNSETANYIYNGWATSSTGEKVYNNTQSVRNLTTTHLATVSLYANWTPTSVMLPTPTRTGYLFQGWYDAATGGNKIGDGGANYTPTQTKILYAHWTPITYYISYNGNGATGGSTETSTHTYDQYKNLSPNGYTRAYTITYNYNGSGQTTSSETANYIHNGWTTNPTGDKVYNREQSVKNLTTTHLATVPLYATWTPTAITLPTPTRTGHNFLGWYDKQTGGNKIGNGGESYTPTGNTTMYAHWEPWTLKVNVNLKDKETKKTIQNNANFKVYAYNKNTGNYDTFVRNLTQKEDKTYETSDYLVYSDTNLGKFRIIEETAPYGYYGDWQTQEQTTKNYYDIDIEEIIRTKNYLGQTVADKGSITMIMENTRTKAQIETNIIDIETKGMAQADATLEGAVYGIYAKQSIIHADGKTGILYQAGDLVQRKTIENGRLTYDDLELGEYYIKQITPSKGYTKSETMYSINLPYEGEKIQPVKRAQTVEEKVNKQAFQLVKIGNVGGSTEFQFLEGAGFKIYLISSLSKVKSGEITPDENGNYETEDFKYYDFTEEKTALDYSKTTQGENIAEIFTDEEGYLLSPEIAYGKYVVVESTVPEDRLSIDPFLVTTEEDNRTPKRLRVFFDEEFRAKIQIIKKDTTTGKTILKPNTQYRIFNKTTNEYEEQWLTYPTKVLLGTAQNPYTTNETGTMETPLSLAVGEYEIQEVTAPQGYVLEGKEGKSIQGTFTKTPKERISFKISKTTVTEYDEDTGDAVLRVAQYNEQQLGSLTINVTGEYLSGYTKDTNNNYDFQYQTRPIEGVEYTIYAKYNIYSQDNQKDIVYQKDEVIASIKSDEQGRVIIDNLPIGSYYVKETKSANGFTLNHEIKDITIEYEGQEKAVVYRDTNYIDQRQKIKIELINKDVETGETLPGGKFGLYTKKEIRYFDNEGIERIIPTGELIAEIEADENGIAKWDEEHRIDLPLGSYEIKQTNAPYGYITNNIPIEINGEYRGQDTKVIEINMEMTNQQSKTMIKIQDEETKNGLALTQMKLLDKDKAVIQEWTTEESGEKYINKLQRGETYILQETKARDNYVNKMIFGENQNEMANTENAEIEEITFVVKDVLDLQNIIIENKAKVGNISLEKQGEVLVGIHTDDKGNKHFQYETKNLAGATYYLYAKEDISHPDGHTGIVLAKGEEVAQITTSTEGAKITNIKEELVTTYSQEVQKLLQRGLLLGKYEVEEVQAPEGYYKETENSKHEIVLEEETNNKEVIIKQERYENIRQKIKIELNNKDQETGEPLTGGKFELYTQKEIHYIDQNGNPQTIPANEKIAESQTDENGMARWDSEQNIDLPLGSYYIKQTEAPYGYITNNTPIEINGEYRGQETKIIEINIEMTNQPSKIIVRIQDEETKNGLAETQMKLLDKDKAVIQEWTAEESGEKNIQKLQIGEIYTLQEIKPRANYEAKMIIGENQNEMANIENTEIEEITFVVNDVEEQQNIIVGNRAKVGNISLLKQGEVLVGVENDEEGNKRFQYELQNLAGAEYNVYAKEDISHPDGQTGVILTAGTPIVQVTTTIEGIKITKIEESLINEYPEEVQKLLQRGLPLGTYEMEEIKAPKGYYRDLENYKQEVKVEENGSQEVVNKEVSIKNERQMIITKDPEQPTPPVDPDNPDKPQPPVDPDDPDKPQPPVDPDEPDTPEKDKIGIFKQDEETKEVIQGAEIGIYVAEDIKENDKIILTKDELVEKAITDEKGQIQLKHNLPLGKYYVQEIKASKGYAYKGEKIAVEYENLEETTKNVNLYVEITNKATEVDIIKTDKEKNPVPGAKLQLQDEEGNVIDEWESTDEKHKITKLETEKVYKIVEIQPAKGYVTAKEVTFSLDKYGKIVTEEENQYDETTVMIKGEKTKITITVVDEETEEKIEGVHIQIIDKETGEVVYEMDTTKEEVIIEGLPIGEYEVIQTTDGGGYVTTKMPITVEDKEGIQEKILKQEITKLFIEIKDNEENIDVEATKIEIKDKETGKVIASTEISENKEEADKIIKIEKVDGGYIVKRLEPKEYEIETTLPDGYKEIENVDVTIQDTSELQKIKLETRKLILDMQVKKYLNNIFINGEAQNINKENMNKVEVHRKAVSQTQIKLEYIVEVSNIGEIAGNIAKIIDQLPEGMTFEKEGSDNNWEMEGNNLVIKEFADKELGVGESRQYKIVAKWNNQQDNFGSKVNTASIEGIGNKLNYKEKTDGQESNIAKVVTLFSLATGENMKLILEVMDIAIFCLISIGILVVIEIKILNRKDNKKRN